MNLDHSMNSMPTTKPLFLSKYLAALSMAAKLHQTQTRKETNVPYFSHLESTAAIVWKNGGTETEAVAALLHDVLEDQGGLEMLNMIELNFGSEVADIVLGCSEPLCEPKPSWLIRKTLYLKKLKVATQSVRLVAAADKLDNIQDIYNDYLLVGESIWKRFNAEKDLIIWFYQSAGEIFIEHGPKVLGMRIVQIINSIRVCHL